ncbi:MAG: hypothetical protein Q7J72_10085, partial [Candidatus Omnitrophota bacterium]|nr:hypothetical protein [Candidatus Omnitrophota bacterium]
NLSGYLNQGPNLAVSDRFRPINLRYFSYQPQTNDFKILLDKGDSKDIADTNLKDSATILLDYFKIGLSLPNDKFWVNLRPDSQDQIIDDELAQTDLGKVMLEADLKLKQDTALFTSPKTPQGKAYWNKLYQRAGELFGTENITIPTLTRPWIVPGEIILRESADSANNASGAYIYKANLKVMLEEDYLKTSNQKPVTGNQIYSFSDPRLKELNQYSTQLIRELILPKLTQTVNSSKDYANLRQVYFSLILARWFKETFSTTSPQSIVHSPQNNSYIKMIDSHNLTNLSSKEVWDKATYFNAYQKSFKEGEYNLSEPVYTPTGQVIRRYMSGGTEFNIIIHNNSDNGLYTATAGSAIEARDGEVSWDGTNFSGGSPLLEEKKNELGAILDRMKSKLTKAQFLVGNYFEDAKKMIVSKQDPVGIRKSVYEIISELGELSQDKAESVKSEMEKLKEFYAYLNADMFGEKLQKAGLTKALIDEAISGMKSTKATVSFTGLPTDAFTKGEYYLPTSLLIEGAWYYIKIIAGEHKDGYKAKNQNKYMILELVPKDNQDTLLPLIELRVYVDNVIRSIINYGGHKAPKKKDSQEKPYKERQREIFNKLFNSEPLEAGSHQAELVTQLMRALLESASGAKKGKSAAAGSAVLTESLDKLYEVISKKILEGLPSLFSSENKIKVVGYLRNLRLGDLKLGEIKELPGNLEQLIDKTKSSVEDNAKISEVIEEVKNLCDSINAGKIMAEALANDDGAFQDLSIERIDSSFSADSIKIGATAFNFIKINGFKAVINVMLYKKMGDVSPALTIAFENRLRSKSGSIKEVKSNFEAGEFTILQLQNLSGAITETLERFIKNKHFAGEAASGASEIASSALTITKKPEVLGGIDFRSMNMLVQPAGSFTGLDFSLPMLSRAEIESFDLDRELADIRNMVRRGVAPSGQRLKEYLAVCFEKGETKDKIDSLILCLADIFELQQFEAREASPDYKEALVIADTRRYTIKEDRFAVSEKNPYSLN